MTPDQSLLGKVALRLREAPAYAAKAGAKGSILAVAASAYGSRPDGEEITQPTGFDPNVAALFEAVVESAFLVANADLDFDEDEHLAFKQVVLTACVNKVTEKQVEALLADLTELLKEDGLEKRTAMVARTVKKPEHAQEVLRIAALIAQVSGGVSDVERRVLERLGSQFGLSGDAVDAALAEVAAVLKD